MRGGLLRKLLSYQVKAVTKDSHGQLQDDWTIVPAVPVWGQIRSPTGREALNASQLKAVTTHVVTTRYPGFLYSAAGRFAVDGRIFNIRYVLNVDERNRQVDCLCEEQTIPATTD